MTLLESVSVTLSTFALIALAEIGDKSQLVCTTLAARHRHWPVLSGATIGLIMVSALGVWAGRAVLQRPPSIGCIGREG